MQQLLEHIESNIEEIDESVIDAVVSKIKHASGKLSKVKAAAKFAKFIKPSVRKMDSEIKTEKPGQILRLNAGLISAVSAVGSIVGFGQLSSKLKDAGYDSLNDFDNSYKELLAGRDTLENSLKSGGYSPEFERKAQSELSDIDGYLKDMEQRRAEAIEPGVLLLISVVSASVLILSVFYTMWKLRKRGVIKEEIDIAGSIILTGVGSVLMAMFDNRSQRKILENHIFNRDIMKDYKQSIVQIKIAVHNKTLTSQDARKLDNMFHEYSKLLIHVMNVPSTLDNNLTAVRRLYIDMLSIAKKAQTDWSRSEFESLVSKIKKLNRG